MIGRLDPCRSRRQIGHLGDRNVAWQQAEAAVRRGNQPLGVNVFQRPLQPLFHLVRRLNAAF